MKHLSNKKINNSEVSYYAEDLRKQRIKIELKSTKYALSRGKQPLLRGASGKIISFTPAGLRYNCNVDHRFEDGYGRDICARRAYGALSKQMHEVNTPRTRVEREIHRILGEKSDGTLTFELVGTILKSGVVELYNELRLPLPKKAVQNRLINLANKFVELSTEEHYKLTTTEKSLLKRWNKC